ncbi:hypothetical protein [Helicobacter sp. T3_23-1056]
MGTLFPLPCGGGLRGRVNPSLRESATLLKVADSWQSIKEFCHTERSEVSQSIYLSLQADFIQNPRGNPKTTPSLRESATLLKIADSWQSTMRYRNNRLPRSLDSKESKLLAMTAMQILSMALFPPPFAEGARGWVSLDSTAVIVGKDSASVIASVATQRVAIHYLSL